MTRLSHYLRLSRPCHKARTDMKDLRRPTSGQDAANGRGGRTGQFPAVAPYDNRPSTGTARPTSSPSSPLVGVGGSLKRPSSGSLPVRF